MSERNTSRRTFLKTTGVVAAVGLGSTIPASAAEISNAPVPDDTDALTYATMGTDKDNPTAKLYGNFKCPYTQEFVRGGNLEAVLNEYVASGDLNIQFRALAYQPPGTSSHGTSTHYISDSDPLISEAAMGVWDVSPGDYWQFFNYMFSDLISGNVSFSEMESRMQSTSVSDRSTIIDRASSGTYDNEVEQNRYSAGDYGVTFTPTLVLDGETIPPHHDTNELLEWIGSRISSSSTSSDTEEDTDSSDDESNSESSSDENNNDSSSDESNNDNSSVDSSDSDASEDASSSDSSSSDSSSSDSSSSDSSSSEGSESADSNSSSGSSSSSDDRSSEDQSSSSSPSEDTSASDNTSSNSETDSDSEQSADNSGSQSISIGEFCRMFLK
ncbi:Tat (twin-arginine translocation) pathway signal sequence [Haladaptatus litoreus]|uniref:Tat (Twin-arginine translocation) pathway signal sequence n=1 Tax=Haladaptatus litoreus TaxID=553468 RepID=A0A1N7DCP4_9EURY|nr:thioredoxin domain-containing protein [Haladaptatus litoreus]SIR73571.1 Tat (twin-arginine translocation) pathway signal sequence [Haladaptatus litoreus]